MLINTIIEIFGLEEEYSLSHNETSEKSYTLLDSHLAVASGHWNGWKIVSTDKDELSKVIQVFKTEFRVTVAQVRISFKFLFLTKF